MKIVGKIVNIMSISLLLSLLLVMPAHAANNTLTLSSSAQKANEGQFFKVTVTVTAEDPITIALVYITYDPNQLLLTNISYTDSPLNNETPDYSKGEGYLKLGRFKAGDPYPTGSFKVAELTFQARQGSGEASVNILQENSQLYTSTNPMNNELTSVSGTTIGLQPAGTEPSPEGTTTSDQISDTSSETDAPAPETKQNNTLWLAVVGLLVVVAAATVWYLIHRKPKN